MTTGVARVSEREAEVLAALGQHLSNAQIASRLHLSVRTVETHVSSLLRKLEVTDRRALAELAPTFAAVDASARGVPTAWTPFIGRRHELDDITEAVAAARLVTLLGPGGVGKTRLAAEVTRQLAPSLPLGATFVELVSARPGFFVATVAAALGVTERPGQTLLDAVVARLKPGRSLLVLDNFEHLIDDTAEFLTALLGEATDVHVLTTSRTRIGVPGERVVPLLGLSVVAASTGGAVDSEAVALFFDRARTLDAQFDADPVVVGELCAQLDGMPLAIELATARSATLGIAGLRAGLADRLRLLSGGQSGDPRHRSLRTMLDWSHELLDDEERTALRRLGRFAGDVDLDSAAAIIDLPPSTVADLVGRLADRSLLVHRPDRHRWALLETVRSYALDKLAEAGELDAATNRYIGWAVATSTEIEAHLNADEPWRAEFEPVADDLRAALGLAAGETAAQLARSLGHLSFARRFLAEARGHYVHAAECTTDPARAAQDFWSAASIGQIENRGQFRYEYVVAAAARAAAAGDPGTQAAVLAEAVSVASRFPAMFEREIELDELLPVLEIARTIAPPDDRAATAQLAAAEALTSTRLVERPDVALFATALEAAEQADDPLLISAALDVLGLAQIMTGHLARTHELDVRRLSVTSRLPSHLPRAGSEIYDALHMAVENAISAGDLAFALAAAQRFEDELVAAPPLMIESKQIVVLVLTGRFDDAIARAERTRRIWDATGRPTVRWLAPSMYAIVLGHGLRGDDEAADDWRRFAAEVAGEQTRNMHFRVDAMTYFVEARLAMHFGRPPVVSLPDPPTRPDAWWQVRHWSFDAYPAAATAELAVVSGRPDAAAVLDAVEPVAGENAWAAAVLARARFRLGGDPRDFDLALDRFEQLDARYERACTLALIPARREEAQAELDALGVATMSGDV